jgi:hypothetical protein
MTLKLIKALDPMTRQPPSHRHPRYHAAAKIDQETTSRSLHGSRTWQSEEGMQSKWGIAPCEGCAIRIVVTRGANDEAILEVTRRLCSLLIHHSMYH